MLPNEIAGKYELRGTLGAGAMGTVYEAVDRLIERRVAIKVVKKPPPGDPEGEEAHARFRREAQAAGRLAHNNIVGVYDYGENAETAWIVMELVEGGSVKDRLDRKERFPVAEIVRLMDGVLSALAYSHGRGVVHRDIKPANIMLAADGTVKMADFGIARLENSSMTQVGTVMGTPSYMAPEQLRGETVDARADIWAAGVMLYQLLTGEKPFDGGLAALMHKVMNAEPIPPSQLAGTCPRAFDAVVAKALAKRPEDRWPTATAFAEAIRRAASGEAPPPPLPAEADPEATLVQGARPAAVPAAPLAGRTADPFDAAPAVSRAPAPPAPPPAAGAKAEGGKGSSLPLIAGGGAAALVAAGVAAFFLLGSETPAPIPAPPPRQDAQMDPRAAELERQRIAAEQAAAARAEVERRAREDAARQAAAGAEQAQRQAAAQAEAERQVAEQRAREEATRQTALSAQQRAEEERRRAEKLANDLRQAGAAAVAAAPCSLLTWSATPTSLTISGVLRRGGEAAVQQAIAARGVPPEAVRLQMTAFEGPYCQALELVRPVAAAPDGAPSVTLIGTQPFAKGELLRMDVGMPPVPAQLYVAYFMQSGEVAHLVPSRPEAANARPRLGEPSGGFTGWEVDEPFGTDLALVFASDRPIFTQRRPTVEQSDTYLSALAAGIRQAQAQGGRVTVRAQVIETVLRR
ncbi:serine/threonine-protein kinase [Siccirubricoccus sp. KC 17139]|uniref:Serine/threonine-protein kinase n=1 Tax=Siccirubricoccus soli TaxID=2899147 RepID=A0ABT1DAP1_9PROT|nr:serine/threonine-protein kinase [Siccirubricoccus soli]MCO6419001.1 serine/threonine-protein kinase [Siccirubricoccus soli]MCP2685136.1 serine/threonine-protein kinase [Siccirubricoccus soli]